MSYTEDFLQYVADYVNRTRPRIRSTRLATIDRNYNPASFKTGVNPRVIFDGEEEPTRKRYPVLGPYWPQPGDRVTMQPVGRGYYVISGPVEIHNLQTLRGAVLPGNMATGVVNVPGDQQQTDIEYGPLIGTGPTRVFVTVDAGGTTLMQSPTVRNVSESGATVRLNQENDNNTARDIFWLAVRGMDP